MERRTFFQSALCGAAGIFAASSSTLQSLSAQTGTAGRLHIAVNQYTANNIYQRDGKSFLENLAELKSAGADGFEPTVGTAADLATIGKKLKDNGLEFPSIYTGGNLHDAAVADKEAERLLSIGAKGKELGVKYIVFNAAPKQGKTDEELVLQSKKVDFIGSKFAEYGITLALHYHTTELEFGGREFYHLLNGTDPKHLSLCLEEHWSYRASGNSQVALFDHLKMFADRVSMVHLRQSAGTVWSETFSDGDIDNVRLAAGLKALNRPLHFVLEQASEKGTPKTLPAAEVFRQSCEYIRKVFA
jgi:inosose dehydratase